MLSTNAGGSTRLCTFELSLVHIYPFPHAYIFPMQSPAAQMANHLHLFCCFFRLRAADAHPMPGPSGGAVGPRRPGSGQNRLRQDRRVRAAHDRSHHGPAGARKGRGAYRRHRGTHERACGADPPGDQARSAGLWLCVWLCEDLRCDWYSSALILLMGTCVPGAEQIHRDTRRAALVHA